MGQGSEHTGEENIGRHNTTDTTGTGEQQGNGCEGRPTARARLGVRPLKKLGGGMQISRRV